MESEVSCDRIKLQNEVSSRMHELCKNKDVMFGYLGRRTAHELNMLNKLLNAKSTNKRVHRAKPIAEALEEWKTHILPGDILDDQLLSDEQIKKVTNKRMWVKFKHYPVFRKLTVGIRAFAEYMPVLEKYLSKHPKEASFWRGESVDVDDVTEPEVESGPIFDEEEFARLKKQYLKEREYYRNHKAKGNPRKRNRKGPFDLLQTREEQYEWLVEHFAKKQRKDNRSNAKHRVRRAEQKQQRYKKIVEKRSESLASDLDIFSE